MFHFDEDHDDNGFDVAAGKKPSSDPFRPITTSSTLTSPAGLIHNSYCQDKAPSKLGQNFYPASTGHPFGSSTAASVGNTITTAPSTGVAASTWRCGEELIHPSPLSTGIFGKPSVPEEAERERRSFYVGGEDSDFEDEIESLIGGSDSSEDYEGEFDEPTQFALDDDSGIGTISTEPSLEDDSAELCDKPMELISLPRSIRCGSVGRRVMTRNPRGRKQRLQFTDFYELTDDHLGQGAYASVRTAVQKSTRKEFAVKLVNKHEAGHTRAKIMREVEIFKMCKGHPNIVQLIQWFEDDNYYYMVFEKMRGGPLLNHIQAKSCFTEEEASQVTKDIATALKFLHDKLGVAHRDIKPENILCTDPDRVSPVKICDLDLASKPQGLTKHSRRFGSDGANQGSENAVSRSLPVVHSEPDLASPVGSAEFMAPEVVEAFTGDKFKYDKRCDIWALGVVVYVMLCGYPPFYGQCDNENCKWDQGEACDDCQENLFKRIQIGEFDFPEDEGWADISEDAKDLIRHLLVKNVRERYTADDVLKHPWVVHEAPQTPLQTATNLIYRNDSARDISMMNENFNAINRYNGLGTTIDEGDTSSGTGSPPTPTTLFPGETIKQAHYHQFVPVHTPAHIQAQSPYGANGYYIPHPSSQPQMINMNGTVIYAPPMAPTYLIPTSQGYTSEIRNGTTYYHQPQGSPWFPSMPPQTQPPQPQSPAQHHVPRSLDHSSPTPQSINGAFSKMGLETCQNAMNRQDSQIDIHSKQTRETQVNV